MNDNHPKRVSDLEATFKCINEQGIFKSESDAFEYRLIELNNQMRVILVSDVSNIVHVKTGNMPMDDEEVEEEPDIQEEPEMPDDDECMDTIDDFELKPQVKPPEEKMAACSLSISVGSFSDPPDIPGLAHFLEHMVFMGSQKYPKENSFDEFLQKHGGSDNASTDCEMTTFYFECHEKYLKEGMDRFSQFFIAPLMKREAMAAERQIVHSEFEMSLPSDPSRREQVLATLAPDKHPAGKFLWGNMKTLKDDVTDEHLYKQVHDFRERHYSAHRMTLAVQARLPLNTLETYVRNTFTKVPNNNLPPDDFSPYVGTFGDHNKFNNLIYVQPVKDILKVYLTWVLPSYMKQYASRPLDYVAWFIGHEGKGSLLNFLRQKLLALGCTAGNNETGFEHNQMYSLFTIELKLTEKGMAEIKQVLLAVFGYLAMLCQQVPKKEIFDELDTISKINFRFKAEEAAALYVETLAESMHLYEPRHYIAGGDLYFEYRPDLISNIIMALAPDTVNIMLEGRNKPDDFYDRVEPWFGTKYKIEELPKNWLHTWSKAKPDPYFQIPERNPYLPSKFSILEKQPKQSPYPTQIIDTELMKVWFKEDNKFERPVAFYYFYIISPLARESPMNAVLMDCLVEYLALTLMEHMYPASQAGLGCQFQSADFGLYIKFNGYNEKLPLFIAEMLNLIRGCCDTMLTDKVSSKYFEAIKAESAKAYYNTSLKPKNLVKMTRLSLLFDVYWTCMEKREASAKLTINELHEFAVALFDKCFVHALIQGNLTSAEARDVCSNFEAILRCSPLVEPKPKLSVTQLQSNTAICRVPNLNSADVNAVTTNYYQAGPATIETSCIVDLLMQIMEEPLFDQLRTKQQLGYNVNCQKRVTVNVLAFSITVHYQYNKFTADQVDERVEDFLERFVAHLKLMPSYDFEDFKTALYEYKSTADLQLDNEVVRNFEEITSGDLMFDRQKLELAVIPKITQDQLVKWYESHIKGGPDFKKLGVQVVGCGSADGIAKTSSQDIKSASSKQVGLPHFIADINSYKSKRQFYDLSSKP